jgi:hypothetical protein
MAEQESAAVRNANKHFRKEEQARQGAAAWKEYVEQEEVTRLKTARLRAQRLARDSARDSARDAATASTSVPVRKPSVKSSSKSSVKSTSKGR